MSDPRAVALRQDFDRSFAPPHGTAAEDTEDLLAIRVSGEPLALRLKGIASLIADRRIVPVPSRHADCLGMAGIRGRPVPVFDLAVLLGLPALAERPRWMILVEAEEPIALAFTGFEGHLRAPRSAFHLDPAGDIVRTQNGSRSIVPLSKLVSTIRSRAGGSSAQEQ